MNLDLHKCACQWVEARERFLKETGRFALDEYQQANEWLYVAFAEGWKAADEKTICKAFCDFRKVLMQEADRGNPARATHHPCPIMPAKT